MNYIYDIFLNFKSIPYDFFEWNNKDKLTHLKKVPIYKIDINTFKNFCHKKIKVNSDFLNNIKYKTEIWKTKDNLKFCSLFYTNFYILAICFNENGISEKKSFLYIDEELEVLNTLYDIKEKEIEYNIIHDEKMPLKTRKQIYIDKFIKNNLKNIEEDKLKYIYFECFGKNDTKNKMIEKLKNMKNNSKEYKKLYNILKIITTAKK